MIKYVCAKCKKEVNKDNKFVAEDGRILCQECSNGVAPAPTEVLAKSEIISAVDDKFGINILKCEGLKIENEADNIIYSFVYLGNQHKAIYSIENKDVKII